MFPPIQYLSKIKPFSFLSDSELTELIESMEISLYRKDEIIFKPKEEISKFYFIREGKVGLFYGSELMWIVEKDEIIETTFSTTAIEFTAKALEDSIIFEFEIAILKKILQKNVLFKEFLEKLISGKFLSLLKLTRMDIIDIYERPIGMMISRAPIFCFKGKTIKEVIELMNENDVGSIVVVDPENKPIGIVTHSDLLKIIGRGIALTESVEKAMSYPVIKVNFNAPILEAYLKFLSYGINHLVVVDNERLAGVISIKDLIYNIEPPGHFLKLKKEVLKSKSLEEIKKLSQQVNLLIKNALEYGFSYPAISRLISTIFDTILKKIFTTLEVDSNTTIITTGIYGRREIDFPLKINLLIINEEEDKRLSNILFDLNIQFEYCKSINQFLDNLQNIKLLNLLDARYIFGNRINYVKFKDHVKEMVRQKPHLIKIFIDKDFEELEDVSEMISNITKVLSYIHGDISARPIWERLDFLKSRNIIDGELANDLIEGYITLRTIELSAKINNEKPSIDRIVYKKIVKRAMEYKSCIRKMIG
ncbi:MAG: CBS domain-containing protein [Candidatus Methanomethyliaceae archaeon]|nr:CBS domain-containing protein [Candidatus Methanomethyliaceae archaeon]MDW7970637.1 CBS domain-containing protein [Nitrososphaerota archaeon]